MSPIWIIPVAAVLVALAIGMWLAKQLATEAKQLGREVGRLAAVGDDVMDLFDDVEDLATTVGRTGRR
jgi:geranylgeranyl pyrophosphate synthase